MEALAVVLIQTEARIFTQEEPLPIHRIRRPTNAMAAIWWRSIARAGKLLRQGIIAIMVVITERVFGPTN